MLTNILICMAIIVIAYGVYQWFSIKATVQQQEYNIRETMNIVQDLVNVVGSPPQTISGGQHQNQSQPIPINLETNPVLEPCPLSELGNILSGITTNIYAIDNEKICVSECEGSGSDSESDSGYDSDSDSESDSDSDSDDDEKNKPEFLSKELDTEELSVHSAVDGVFDLGSPKQNNIDVKEDEKNVNSMRSNSDSDSDSDSDFDSETDADSIVSSNSVLSSSELSPVLLEPTKDIKLSVIDDVIDNVVKVCKVKSEEVKSEEVKSEEVKSEEVKSEEVKSEEVKSEEVIKDDNIDSVDDIIRNIENDATYDDETDFEMTINATSDHTNAPYKKWPLQKLKNLITEREIVLEDGLKYKKNDYISLLEAYDEQTNC
jgi:hypothetical protein